MAVTLTKSRSTEVRELAQVDSGLTPLKAILRLILLLSVSSVARLRSSEDFNTNIVTKGRDKARKEMIRRVNKLNFLGFVNTS